jgi:nucleoid-associated protein EbfC
MAGLGDLAGLLKQAQRMQQEMAKTQEALKQKIIEGSAGGGMVKVQINGGMDIVSVEIDPQCIDPKEPEVLEDLVLAATKQALDRAREMAKNELGKLTGGLSLPGMF